MADKEVSLSDFRNDILIDVFNEAGQKAEPTVREQITPDRPTPVGEFMNATGPEHAAAERATPPGRIRPEHDRFLRRTLAVRGDFSGVRVHADGESADLAKTLGANAFTHASHLFFEAGRHRPDAPAGWHLLRHESLHAMQQEHAMLQPLRDESRELDPAVRMLMERSMNASFGDVVVHTGEASSEAAEGLGAAAFTVGRHVVFGPGRYDPVTLRGRMLLAHELAHVVEQRRGGGNPDLGERTPLSSLTRHSAHSDGHGRTAAQAALGASAPVAGATGTGVARQSTDEERSWWKEAGRTVAKGIVGTIEGVAMEGGQIVDTLLWAEGKVTDLTDDAIDTVGEGLGASKEMRDAVKTLNNPVFKDIRKMAAETGMLDKATGALTVSPAITKGFDAVDEGLDATVFEGMRPEDTFFTTRDISQIVGAIGSQAFLSTVGVEEVQLALKVVSGLGAFKAVVDAINRNPTGFGSDRAFWMAVAQAGLHVIGLKSASSGKKLLNLAVHIGSTVLATSNEVATIIDAYNMEKGPERDEKLKGAIKGLIRVLSDQIRQMISSGRGLPKKGSIEESEGAPAKPAAKAEVPFGPPAPTTAPVKPPVTTPEPVTSAPPNGASVKPASSKISQTVKSGAKGKLTPKPVSKAEGPAKVAAKPAAPAEEATPQAKSPGKTRSGLTARTKTLGGSAKRSSPTKTGASTRAAAKQAGAAGKAVGKTKPGSTQPGNKRSTHSPEVKRELAKLKNIWKKSKPNIWRDLAQDELVAREASAAGKGGAAAQRQIVDPSKAPRSSSGKGTASTSKAPTAESPFGSRMTHWDPGNPPPGYVYAKGVKGWEGFDPVKALTDAELKGVANTGKMPPRVQAELEHARIPQRVGAALVGVGVLAEEASAITKQTDPRNLVPVNRESHAWMDEVARKTGAKRNPTLPAALDDRDVHPLGSATNEEITAIISALKKPNVKLNSKEGGKLREWLTREKKARGASATWEVP